MYIFFFLKKNIHLRGFFDIQPYSVYYQSHHIRIQSCLDIQSILNIQSWLFMYSMRRNMNMSRLITCKIRLNTLNINAMLLHRLNELFYLVQFDLSAY